MDNALFKASERMRALLDCQGREKLTAAYDHMGSDYDTLSDVLGWVGPAEITKMILKVEPNKNARILDVGCGTGYVGSKMWEAGYRNLHGVDMSENFLNTASKKGVYSKLIHATFGPDTPLSYENGGYLAIITRKPVFENEEGGMKLKTSLRHFVKDNILKKIFYEDIPYRVFGNIKGVALCYQVN